MFKRRWALLTDMTRLLDTLDRRAEKVETILMVREPASGLAAEAYDGLRRQVVSAVSERLAHLSQLVQIDAAVRHGAEADVLMKYLDEWFEQAGLRRITDPADLDLFEMVEDLGGPVEVVAPAYTDVLTGRLIRPGRARRSPVRPEVQPEPETEAEKRS